MISISLEKLKTNIIIILFLISLFLSHSQFFDFQLRFIYLFCIFFFIKDLIENKKFHKYLFLVSLIIPSFIFLHSYVYLVEYNISLFYLIENMDKIIKLSYQCILIFLTILIIYFSKNIILKHFDKIIFYFLLFFFTSLIYYQLSNEINIFNFLYSCNTGLFSITKFLYTEDSHFHIVSVPVILYLLLNYQAILKNYIFLFLSILFTIFSFGIFSLTFYLSINLACIFIFFISRKINKIKIILLITLIIFNNLFFFNQNTCEAIKTDYFDGRITSPKDKLLDLRKTKSFLEDETGTANLSLKIYLSSLVLAQNSITDNFFGVGLNNYSKYYLKVNKDKIKNSELYPSSVNALYTFNSSDGSNNFAKVIVEFGAIGIIFFIFLFLKSFTIQVSDPIKIFLYTSLIIQLIIRGAGFFNNGFFLILIILLMIIFERKKNDKKFI